MESKTIHIGFDDTDSPKGMCTTYLAYRLINLLKKENVDFLDFPNLIRFNPNIPWKTRGNGAVAIKISTKKPEKIKKMVRQLVNRYADTKNGANPGVVFFEQEKIPKHFGQFSTKALWKLIKRNDAKIFIKKNNIESFYLGNGQGLVGAIGAISYQFSDNTFELLSYRNKSKFGLKRNIDKKLVKEMQQKTFPYTFNSYDHEKEKILISPNGPDPVFFGVRGENPSILISAAESIKPQEKLDGYLIFKSNQGTGDHLKNKIDVHNFEPYTSGTIQGTVESPPIVLRGGHLFFSINSKNKNINCCIYKPTKITHVAKNLIKGDKILIGGGVRKASKNFDRVFNIEFLKPLHLEKNVTYRNPLCKSCNKRMKSKGVNQGFQCRKCGKKSKNKTVIIIPRTISKKMYVPSVSAHRHLTKPIQRFNKTNQKNHFNKKIQWHSKF
jgi:tRNA(Ile2)-agmatinylcytidine synthase|tara:strand:- start:369 stop:1688 length:1320 start_codon:yes stop_codon:yes gene_type:complete